MIDDPDHSDNEDHFILLEKRTSVSERFMRNADMREHYDFSDSAPNPYAQKLKKQITIRLDEDTMVMG